MLVRRGLCVALVILLAVSAGCAPKPQEPAPPAPAPAAPAAPATPPAPPGPVPGGRVIVGLQQEPPNLNPYFINMATGWMILRSVLEPLVGITSDGEYFPQLAAEVPTLANGLVSSDGLKITYKLKPGIAWSDGAPFTSKDVKFTFEVLSDPANPLFSTAGYNLIDQVETPDDLTAVVCFKTLYAPYLTLFPWILPAHAAGGSTDLSTSDFNVKPFGTGPFMITEWQSGSHVATAKNPNYRESGKPYLDQLVFRFIPTFEAGVAQLKTGEIDILSSAPATSYSDLSGLSGVRLDIVESTLNERIIVQWAQRGNPADASKPHAILGDIRVRRAIDLAIDRQKIIDTLLFGLTTPSASVHNLGWYADSSLAPRAYDPEQAKTLLTEAGWLDTGGKVREKGGQPLKLELTINSGNLMRELTAQVIQEQLAEVGIEITIRTLSASVLWALYADGGVQSRGDFDLSMSGDGPYGAQSIDPDAFLFGRFHSKQIPTQAGGYNTGRFVNAELDRLVEEAAATVDMDKRAQNYFRAARILNDEVPWVLLYVYIFIDAIQERIEGAQANTWVGLGWDTQEWHLKQ